MSQHQPQQIVDHRAKQRLGLLRQVFEGLRQVELGGARAQRCLQGGPAQRHRRAGEALDQ
ncbi:hypothetical protein MGAST_17100 [Mycobacterium gastri 'Wayne']|uniref:Uncharacterized protein n=1 Tax=Mycobacterium gastri TaxID=1777 RepID=A0A1X1VCL7_MYCGS|nr:hypothetical protein MGAST_17100 [Mycobacterium gastri 'Wayne']ORV66800.1 hypothetical protein AWC07_10060 [Mycobacterium gastri]